jgi:hypothetical protein
MCPDEISSAKSIGQLSERSRSPCISHHFDNNAPKRANVRVTSSSHDQGKERWAIAHPFHRKGFRMQGRFHESYGPNTCHRYLDEHDLFCSLARICNWGSITTTIEKQCNHNNL